MTQPNVGKRWMMVAAALTLVGCAGAARADERVVAKVPFAFIVGDTRLPPGDYVVKESDGDPSVVAIENADGRELVYALTIAYSSNVTTRQPTLVFEKFDNEYFLSRVAPPDGNEREIVLTPARMERELVKVGVEP